jgi:hypothetical protein
MEHVGELVSFGAALDRPMEWSQQSALRREYELRQDGMLLATLNWRSSMSTLATLTSAEGSWTFKRVGFWSPRVTVRQAGVTTDENLAVFTPGGWLADRGVLSFPDGRRLGLMREGFWSSTWRLCEEDRTLVEIGDVGGMFRHRATVTLGDGVREDPDAPLLAGLLWYLVLLAYADQVVATSG